MTKKQSKEEDSTDVHVTIQQETQTTWKKKVCLRGSEEEERKLARQNEREWLWGLWKGHNEKTHVTYWELQVIE